MNTLITKNGASGRMILDSVSPLGIRLPTIQMRWPRMIHAEFMTHRDKTRNARSGRAVPVITMMEEARFPYVPHFMANKPGMSASEEMEPAAFAEAERIWRELAEHTRLEVMKLQQLDVHKQWANRPLEWFGYIDVLVSATAWENFMVLRTDPTAQPEMQDVAEVFMNILEDSKPSELSPGEWHMPYIDRADYQTATNHICPPGSITSTEGLNARVIELLKKVSTARNARLSYKPFDGNGDFDAETNRYDRLMVSRPVHASPAEHVASPDVIVQDEVAVVDSRWVDLRRWKQQHLHGNFTGWIQHRKEVPYEAVNENYDVDHLSAQAAR